MSSCSFVPLGHCLLLTVLCVKLLSSHNDSLHTFTKSTSVRMNLAAVFSMVFYTREQKSRDSTLKCSGWTRIASSETLSWCEAPAKWTSLINYFFGWLEENILNFYPLFSWWNSISRMATGCQPNSEIICSKIIWVYCTSGHSCQTTWRSKHRSLLDP